MGGGPVFLLKLMTLDVLLTARLAHPTQIDGVIAQLQDQYQRYKMLEVRRRRLRIARREQSPSQKEMTRRVAACLQGSRQKGPVID